MISSNSGGYEILFIVFAQMEKDKDTTQKLVDTRSVNSTNKTFCHRNYKLFSYNSSST